MIQGFVLVAVALGIASTLAIAAVQKTRQIGILKAMGLTDRQSGRIFLWQAAILGVAAPLGVRRARPLALFALLRLALAHVPDHDAAGLRRHLGVHRRRSWRCSSSIIPSGRPRSSTRSR